MGRASLGKAALIALLKTKRARLQHLDDMFSGKNLERGAIKRSPEYQASQGTRRGKTEAGVSEARTMFQKSGNQHRSRKLENALDSPIKKLMKTREPLRKEVTSLVKQLRQLGGKTKDYKKPGMQREISKMKKVANRSR